MICLEWLPCAFWIVIYIIYIWYMHVHKFELVRYCGSAVHQVRRIFKAVPSCWNIASFSPLMYLPCKQQQFVQKYNQRWPKSPSVVATFAAVSEATEYTALWGTLTCSNMGSSQVLVLQSNNRIRRFLLPGSEQWLGKPINHDKPMDFGAPYLWETYRLRHNLSSYPSVQITYQVILRGR